MGLENSSEIKEVETIIPTDLSAYQLLNLIQASP